MDAHIRVESKPSRVALVGLLLVALTISGCSPFRRKAKLPQPIPPVPSASGPASSGPLNPPPEKLDMPKTPQMPPPPKPIEIESPAQEEPEPEAPKPAVHRPAPSPSRTEPAVAEPATPAQTKPAEPLPELAPIMNEAEARTHNAAIDSALATTDRNLVLARSRRNLSVRQRNMMQQAETFASQAREARQIDPVAARSLAERAAQLSQELVASLK